MNYELAKKLKDAGFPQNFKYGDYFQDGRMNEPELYQKECCYPEFEPKDTKACKIPTLSELLEACGERFCELDQCGNLSEWVARGDENWVKKLPRCNLQLAFGLTPEEAVANLWLKLNKK